MNPKEIILLDIEELLNQEKISKNIDYLIEINDIKRDIEDNNIPWEKIKKLYITLKQLYIFEITELKELLTNKEIKELLEEAIEEKNYFNIFMSLGLIEKSYLNKEIKEVLKETLKGNKEYLYLLESFYKKETQEETRKIDNINVKNRMN